MAREVTSKILDGINDLVIMAPNREGFISAYEPVTYATRLRVIGVALHAVRAKAREYEQTAPFADASHRVPSLPDYKAWINVYGMLQIAPHPRTRDRAHLRETGCLFLTRSVSAS